VTAPVSAPKHGTAIRNKKPASQVNDRFITGSVRPMGEAVATYRAY
jgi:hypothetical protein